MLSDKSALNNKTLYFVHVSRREFNWEEGKTGTVKTGSTLFTRLLFCMNAWLYYKWYLITKEKLRELLGIYIYSLLNKVDISSTKRVKPRYAATLDASCRRQLVAPRTIQNVT